MTTISCQRLDEVITSSKFTLDRWADEQKAIADRMAAQAIEQYVAFEKRMEASRDRLLALQLQRGLTINDAENPELEKVQNRIQLMSEENEELEAVLVEKKHAIEHLHQERVQRESLLAQQKHEKEITEIQSKATLDDLTRGLLCYKKLGLDMEKADGERLRLHFTQIDSNNPEKPFTLDLTLEEEWMITDCTLLPSETQKAVVAPLNEENDIARFVRNVRKAFVDHVDG